MKIVIKLIGLAMLVGGGWYAYANRGVEGSETGLALWVAIFGVVLLVGIKGINKFTEWGKRSGFDKF